MLLSFLVQNQYVPMDVCLFMITLSIRMDFTMAVTLLAKANAEGNYWVFCGLDAIGSGEFQLSHRKKGRSLSLEDLLDLSDSNKR